MRTLPAAGLVLAVLLLAGCLPPQPIEATPTPVPTPVFASEEEALAAAEDAYAAYLQMSDLIASEGGEKPERISPFVSAAWYEHEHATYESFANTGRRQQGFTELISATLQRYDDDEVAMYACLDFSQSAIFDQSDADVTPTTRPDRATLLTTFKIEGSRLLVDGSELWPDESC